MLMLIAFSVGNVWAEVESGNTYSTPSASGVPTGWTSSDGGGTSYVKLTEGSHYIQTEEFCQNGFTSIVVKARKFGGPSAGQEVISIEWAENGGGTTELGTVSPTSTTLTNYTLSSFATITANKSGYIKIYAKSASEGKGVGVSEVTITYTEGTCGGGTPKCATPTFSPAAGSYEGTQNVTISSTAGATIYYTTDGSDPKTSATKQTYSSAISVSADMTIKAYATLTSYDDSEVAEAAYTITEGPDVTLNLIDGNWGFPTSNTTEDATYTNSVTGYSVTCHAPTQYKDATTYFFIGKSGAYIILPEFANPVEKIVVVGNSGGSGSVVFNIFDGDDAASTAVTGCTSDQTFEITSPEANKQYTLKVTSGHNLQLKAIKIYYGVAPAVAKPTISGDENFVGSTTVTLACSTTGAEVYYTTDGSDPKTSGTLYSAPFNLTDGATVKAIAKLGSDWSAVAEKEFTKVSALESLAALLEATTSDETAFNVVIENWVVTGVNGSRAWIADAANEKGILLYKSGHNFTVGNKLNGVVIGTKSKLYQGYPELTTLVSTDVTVTTAEAITPRTTTIAALTSGYNKEQGTVVKLENLTYTASTTSFSDGVNSIQADNKLYTASLLDGATYNLTGVVEYLDGAVVKIMPRSVDDVEQTSAASLPEVTGLAALKAEATGTSYLLNLTDAVVTLVDGNNAFIEDATAGALIYFSGHGYAAGDKLNGQYEVTTATYQGKFEITAMEAQTGATKTADAEIPVTTLTIAQVEANFAANESKRIKIVGVNVTDAIGNSDRNGQISDGANTFALYAGKNGVTAAENANIDVIGYPTFFNDAHQFNVWAQADITVNVKEDPELAYDPVSETIEQGNSWSAPTLTNPHSLTISSYASDNESVATVTDAGVIALAGGLGTAVITAHFNGDATYNAGNATYTITVEEADARNKAVSPAAFTTTSGNMNPADITFAADKGGASTAPANYNDGIRLYQISGTNAFGGFVTLKAAKGCTIDQVKITTTNTYTTTVAYSVDGNENLLGSGSVAKSGEYTTPTGLNVESVNILNLGTGSSGRLEIASITVWYTGSPLAIDHYFLGGTYETTFEQNGTFDYTGLEVYAAYDAGETITEPVAGFTVEADLTTAGNKKAEVMLNSVKIAEYDITVTAGKEDPALAYSPVSETITAGDAWSAPTLSNTFNVTPITYSSDKESVATVTSEGVITLAGGYGTAVITAHFDATAAYVESEATYTITVNKPAPTPTSTIYRKVTATADITDGEYLIVYEGDATHDAAVFDGSLDNDNIDVAMKALPVEIVSDEIAGNTDLDAATFTIDVTAGTLQSASGLYIGRTANSNGMDKSTTETYENTFAIAEGEAVISVAAGPTIRYNYANDQLRFRYYKSGQQAIQLYKKETATPPAKDVIRDGLSNGKWGTICPKQTVENVEGAVFYQITYLEEKDGMPYNIYLDEIGTTTLAAGKPYVFIASGAQILGNKTGDAVTAGQDHNGLHGYISATDESMALSYSTDFNASGDNTYVVYDNSFYRINGATNLKSERCYININSTEPSRSYVAPSPVRRRITVNVSETNATTGFGQINSSDVPVKMIIDGKMYILRGEKLFDATGRLVK